MLVVRVVQVFLVVVVMFVVVRGVASVAIVVVMCDVVIVVRVTMGRLYVIRTRCCDWHACHHSCMLCVAVPGHP